MTVDSTTNRVQENGNGVKVAFDFTFKALAVTDLEVYKVDTVTGISTLQTITTDYTATLNTVTDGGTVTYVVAPTATEQSLILRVLTIDQQTDIPTASNIAEVTLEDAYDKGIMVSQQIQEQVDRSLVLDVGSTASNISIPDPTANKALIWNSAGDNLTNSTDDYEDQAANAAASASAAATSASNAATSASDAATSASNAATSETNAANSAASVNIASPTASKHGALLFQNDDDDGYDALLTQGTSGQVLTSGGADAAPSWQDAGGGAWVELDTQAASASSAIDFDNTLITSTYSTFVIVYSGLESAADNSPLNLKLSSNNGSTFENCSFHTGIVRGNSASYGATNSASIGLINVAVSIGNAAGEGAAGIVFIDNPSGTTVSKFVHGSYSSKDFNGVSTGGHFIGGTNTTTAVNFLRLDMDGNIDAGQFTLYGISHS